MFTKQRALLLLGASGLLTSASTVPLQRRDDGCGKPHHSGYNNSTASHTLDSDRTYTIYVPENYDADHKYPLILDYHGAKGDANGQHKNSQYDLSSRGKQYVVVYPNGKVDKDGEDQAWGGAPYTNTTPAEDLQFTQDLVTHIKEQYCIDTNRIYASGKSNGGGFVDTLACSNTGDQFAAFAMAAPALYTDDNSTAYLKLCPKKRAILEVHGAKDKTICYDGTDSSTYDCHTKKIPQIDQWVSWWGQRTCGKNAKPDDAAAHRPVAPENFEATSYSCGEYERIVTHYKGEEMGHCWPVMREPENGDGGRSYCKDRSMQFTDYVLDFFETWDLEKAPKSPKGST
ncbi:uncharacterized protein RCC_05077 [Ramularia collo-cygni]|uniref:feruloyl esterase n=1 Tax=Ramularia collo-cygni TaxID=112498 RepID=A0A2D3USI2_9PEZI|nr:uncharacterized protein RCC_05077 [Ramularia collo-cygni]CZT19231.1 uncharacterized protein RCC_05077 [Ramularia collo-cygni]